MIPLSDDVPAQRFPLFTLVFIFASSGIFLYGTIQGATWQEYLIYRYGLVPKALTGEAAFTVPPLMTLLTSMFLHAGWLHAIGNMLYLWIFGNNVEDHLGHIRFVLFYILCGVAAALVQVFTLPSSEIPMVGASGAISGVLAAYMMQFPKARVRMLIWLGFFVTTINVRAFWFIGVWFIFQILNAFVSDGQGGGVAWWAHIGGFVAGLVFAKILAPRRRLVFPRRRFRG